MGAQSEDGSINIRSSGRTDHDRDQQSVIKGEAIKCSPMPIDYELTVSAELINNNLSSIGTACKH